MAEFMRIRRLHRAPLRIGSVNVSNRQQGSIVNLSDPKVQRDLKNNYDRWVFLDRHDGVRVATNATQVEANMSPFDATTGLTATNLFGAATGGKEYAWGVNLPAGFTVNNIVVYVSTAAGGATTHMWATIATYDGSTNLTYQAATADVTSGTVAVGALSFSPVVSAGVPYVTPYEGQYIFTMTQTAGTSAVALAGASIVHASVAARLAAPIPQNLSQYGNPVTNALTNPWIGAQGGSVTTPPAVLATNAASNFTAAPGLGFVPYTEIS